MLLIVRKSFQSTLAWFVTNVHFSMIFMLGVDYDKEAVAHLHDCTRSQLTQDDHHK